MNGLTAKTVLSVRAAIDHSNKCHVLNQSNSLDRKGRDGGFAIIRAGSSQSSLRGMITWGREGFDFEVAVDSNNVPSLNYTRHSATINITQIEVEKLVAYAINRASSGADKTLQIGKNQIANNRPGLRLNPKARLSLPAPGSKTFENLDLAVAGGIITAEFAEGAKKTPGLEAHDVDDQLKKFAKPSGAGN